MFDGIHRLWQGMNAWKVSGDEGDQVLALLCLCIGLIALLLWMWAKKWEWLRNVTPAAQVAGAGNACGAVMPQGVDHRRLVLEWVVHKRSEGIGDVGEIGELEQKLLKLHRLHLDSAYHIVVSLSVDQGALSPRIVEILGRRFPGYSFVREESGSGGCV
ncbi:MAG: hypothetical protein FWG14_13465 [Peptococcaceae bacterium]|nr:hypothetical protein [Peptococcaceae bacterium]